jgi:hypothetical protein
MNRRIFGKVIEQHTNPRADTRYWLSKSSEERFDALEQLRIQVHGTLPRLQRLHFGTREQ